MTSTSGSQLDPRTEARRRRRAGTAVAAAALVAATSLTGLALIAEASTSAHAAAAGSRVQAWGANDRGQLGNGTTTPTGQAVPVAVSGLSGTVRQVAAATDHTLALMSDGTVWAWGDNTYGELGIDRTLGSSAQPVPVPGLSDVVQVAADGQVSYAVTSDGKVWGWGFNEAYELGLPAPRFRVKPDVIPGLTRVRALSVRYGHGLALRFDGTVLAWGINYAGNLGTATGGPYPGQVLGLKGVTQVAAGTAHNLALLADGTVWGWGSDQNGELGRNHSGSGMQAFVPAPVRNLAHVVGIAAGEGTSYAVRTDGTAWAWGRDEVGQLGLPGPAGHALPVRVSGVAGAVQLVAGFHHAAALLRNGTVLTWGQNDVHQLADPSVAYRAAAGPVPNVKGVQQLAAAWNGTLAVSGPPVVRARAAVIGTVRPGRTVSCRADVIAAATVRYVWLRHGSVIRAATGTTYRLTAADRKQAISCRVSAVNAWGSATSTSAAVRVPAR